MNKIGYLTLLLLLSFQSKAQLPLFGQAYFCQDSSHCETGVTGMLPSRWIEFAYEKSSPFQADQGAVTISQFRKASAKGRLPLLSKPGLKIIAGFSYQQEYMGLSSNRSGESFPWENIDQVRLNNRGLDLVFLHPFRGKAYMVARASVNINNEHGGLRFREYKDDLKFSLSQLMVFRPNPGQEIGLGAYIARSQGRTSTYPLMVYNQTFSSRWGIESVLPSYIRVRRNIGSSAAILFNAKVTGGSYNIDIPGINGEVQDLSIRRAELKTGISYQQELFDPLWIGFDLGVRQPLSMNVFDPMAPRTPIASSSLKLSTYFNSSIFLVPPSKLMEKMKAKSKKP